MADLDSVDDDLRTAGRLGVTIEVGEKGTWFMSSTTGSRAMGGVRDAMSKGGRAAAR